MLVMLLGALEQSIVSVALPVIASQLSGFTLMAWVVSAYLVASTVVTPIYGKLSDIYGRRFMLSCAVVIFVIASLGCALAQTMPQLILMRVLQGIGGGGLLSVAQAAASDVVSPRDRGRIQGYFSSVWVVASLSGPVIGGYLTHYLSWHWIFWINLPLGALAFVAMRRALRLLPLPPRAARRHIDYIGAVLLASGLTAMLMAVTRIGQGIAVAEPLNLALLAGGALVLAVLLWHEGRIDDPIIPLSMFRTPTVAICCGVLFLGFFEVISMSVLLPLRLQMSGISPEISALRLLPLSLAVPLGAFIGGKLMSRTGHYKNIMLCGAVIASGMYLMLALSEPAQFWRMALAMCFMGIGIGMQFPTGLVATQNAVPHAQMGIATALTSFSRLLGGAIGVAVLTAILIALLRDALAGQPLASATGLAADMHPAMAAGAAAEHAGAALMSMFQAVIHAADDAAGYALRQAADRAFRHLFMFGAAVSAISPLLLLWLRELPLRHGAEPVASMAE